MAQALTQLSHKKQQPSMDDALRRGPIWLSMGFRPFFLGAALFGIVATLYWVHVMTAGGIPGAGQLPLFLWHAHEMIFGYALAVVAGFLLTAARTWTGRNTAHGPFLASIVGVWLLGRLTMAGLFGPQPHLAAALGVAFPILFGIGVAKPIFEARSKRNYKVILVLALLTLAAIGVHFGNPAVQRGAIYGALHLIIVLHVVVGGRVIPLFTRNRTGNQAVRNIRPLDNAAIAAALLMAVFAVPVAMQAGGALAIHALASLAAVSGVLQLVRMGTWGTRGALRVPLLAVLHFGYFWIGAGQLLLALSLWTTLVAQTVAIHALTLGVIGTMTVGMMTRVTMGHTGRKITDSKLSVAAFSAVAVSVFARLSAIFVPAESIPITWMVSGSFFALALLIYVVFAWRPLTTPRPDGRAG